MEKKIIIMRDKIISHIVSDGKTLKINIDGIKNIKSNHPNSTMVLSKSSWFCVSPSYTSR